MTAHFRIVGDHIVGSRGQKVYRPNPKIIAHYGSLQRSLEVALDEMNAMAANWTMGEKRVRGKRGKASN